MSNTRTVLSSHNYLAGVLLLILSTAAWSASLITAYLLSREGVSVNTANAARYLIAVLPVFIFLRCQRQSLSLSPRGIRLGVMLGICGYMISFSYLHSTQHIPVSFAVLLLYTAPFLVALAIRIVDRKMLSILQFTAMVIAFIGLAFILEINTSKDLSLIGVMFAFFAALGLAGQITIANYATQWFAAPVLTLYALTTTTVLLLLTLLLAGDVSIPDSSSAPIKLIIIGVSIAIAQVSMFTGIKRVGPMPAAILMNMEPVFTIGLAILIIGEQLNALQLLGATMVIGAVFAVTVPMTSRSR